MRGLKFAFMVLVLLISCGTAERQADTKLITQLAAYIETHHMPPEEYIVSKFADHDVVFVGEMHRIKHDPEFIQGLIPVLYNYGIYYLGTEFARREDQHLIDSLLTTPTYEEDLARRIVLQQFPFWGYQEYVDILKAAWELNTSLPEDYVKFRILGLNDSPEWWHIKTQEDRESLEVRKKVWHGETELMWARVILDSVVARGENILIHCGIHHAFTEFKQPYYADGKFISLEDGRAGNHVFKEIGKRAITVFLHAGWHAPEGYEKPLVPPADGTIDEVMKHVDPAYRRVGFDTEGTPFGDLPGETSVYKHGYENFTLATFCDGYIYMKPYSEYEPVTPIPDFVNEANIEYARKQAPNPYYRDASIEEFNESIAREAAALNAVPR